MELWKVMENRLLRKEHSFISLTGGGGKTTFLIEFGEYLKKKGMSVLLTTTTKLASPEDVDYRVDHTACTVDEITKRGNICAGSTLFAPYDREKNKLVYPGHGSIERVYSLFDVTIAEADGSRGRPVKIHSPRDPVIETMTSGVVAVVGLWALGKPSSLYAFGDEEERIIDIEYLEELLYSPEGLCKGMKKDGCSIILFNGGESIDKEALESVKSLTLPEGVEGYIVSEREGRIYYAF